MSLKKIKYISIITVCLGAGGNSFPFHKKILFIFQIKTLVKSPISFHKDSDLVSFETF